MTAPTPDLEAILKRVEAASRGPWRVDEMPETGECRVIRPHGADNEYDALWLPVVPGGLRPVTAEFIAHARQDVPALLDALAAVTAERDQAIRNLCDDGPCPVEDLHRDAVIRAVAAERERDQARQMLADAPHGDDCQALSAWSKALQSTDECSCWKAGLHRPVGNRVSEFDNPYGQGAEE